MTQAFLGMRITCARCHNHPLEKWTQREYYQFANLLSRVALKNGAERGEFVVYTSATGEINHPRLARPLPPRPLDGQEVPLEGGRDRRQVLADLVTAADNPFFAKTTVNRVWFHLLGKGIVDPPDDFRDSNPSANDALLDALAKDFVDQDRKSVV